MTRNRQRRTKKKSHKASPVLVEYAAWVLKVTAKAVGFGRCPGERVVNWVPLSQLAGVEDEWGKEWAMPREGMLISGLRIPGWLKDKMTL